MFSSRLLSFPMVCLLLIFPAAVKAADNGATVKSVDGELQLLLPEGWESNDIHSGETQILASNRAKHEFVSVISIAAADFAGTFAEYAASRQRAVKASLVDAKASDGKTVQINGHPAIQYEIHGTLLKGGIKIGYLLSILQMPKHIVQMAAWTTESHFALNAAEFARLPQGLTEVGAPVH